MAVYVNIDNHAKAQNKCKSLTENLHGVALSTASD